MITKIAGLLSNEITKESIELFCFVYLCRLSSDEIPVSRRQSRREEYHQAVNRQTTNTARSLSRVRFCLSPERMSQPKSILKQNQSRTSSVDRDIARLLAVKQQRNSFYASDEDNVSDRSTTDSCLGSLSSEDNSINANHQLETLV